MHCTPSVACSSSLLLPPAAASSWKFSWNIGSKLSLYAALPAIMLYIYCQNSDHFPELTIEFICSVENGAVLPATSRWNSWKSCERLSWLRAWGWDGRAPQPQHTLLAPRRSSDGASAPSLSFHPNRNGSICCQVVWTALQEGLRNQKSFYWLWRTWCLNCLESLCIFGCLVTWSSHTGVLIDGW